MSLVLRICSSRSFVLERERRNDRRMTERGGRWRDLLKEALGDAVSFDEPLASRVAFRIGGPADAFARPHTAEELRLLVAIAREENVPITVLGTGSNVLVLDGGIRGITVRLAGELADIHVGPREDDHVEIE